MKTICIDFDGIVYPRQKPEESIWRIPIEGAFEGMYELSDKGYRIVILTSRDLSDGQIQQWIRKYWKGIRPIPEITNIKPSAIAYIDDRAIRFVSWNDVVHYF